jgi:cation diffusion facilitator family transporter
MSSTAIHEPTAAPGETHRAKRTAALFSVLAAACVTLLKLVTGLLTGSLGMLSESAHSGIDLIASAITLVSVQVSDRPADDDHNYGHGKIESLSAFTETFIMLASCFWLVYEAVHRIVSREHLAIRPSVWPFVVLLLSIAVDFTRSRSLARTARLHSSEALAADAAHFATDMWASAAVMLGLAAAYAGERFGLPWLELADPVAAIAVAGIILHVSWRLARQTIDALLDATPKQTRTDLLHDIAAIPGVLSVDRLRTRRSGANYFADITLGMPRSLTFQRSEQLTMAATAAVQRHLPGADVVVHSVPTATLEESVHDRIRAVAARRNLAIHEISVQQYENALHVDQHLEVDETMSLAAAHALVTDLEAEIRREVPAISTILTHIESEPATIELPASLEPARELEVRLRAAATAFPEILDIHDVLVTRRGHLSGEHAGDHIQVSCHCTLPDALPMARVHAVITALEGAFKLGAPEVDRLLIHPEPATDNRR